MKKNLLFATMVSVAMAFGFTACEEDEDEEFSTTQVTISFDVNGGQGTAKAITTREGDFVPLPSDGISKEGYNLKGWSTSPNGPVISFYAAPGQNTTLYAIWGIIEYNHYIEVEATAKVSDPWDNQFWFKSNIPFNEGDKWEFTMKVKADAAAEIGTQTHKAPGAYIHYVGIGTVPFTTEWKEFKAEGTFEGAQQDGFTIAFNLNDFADANKYYFDDFSLKIGGKEAITNGSLEEGDDVSCFFSKEKGLGGDPVPSRVIKVVK